MPIKSGPTATDKPLNVINNDSSSPSPISLSLFLSITHTETHTNTHSVNFQSYLQAADGQEETAKGGRRQRYMGRERRNDETGHAGTTHTHRHTHTELR